ncbi:unnamed protein product [Rotaria magnacalcarata]|uniref:Uncharacterized protein n=1 Tax=Rotaria magnacalcarata TaxID=392030 RepID=A0A8S3A1B1_9BILA|nr:unnamed protein product [Rotaria magnacalcarata]
MILSKSLLHLLFAPPAIDRLLACMFQIADKRTVSRIINSARQAIVKSFVPDNLSFGHVTREDVIGRHTTTIARELMCGGDY